MKKTFLVKKNPDLPGSEDNWKILNYKQFAAFLETEDGQRRKLCFEIIGNADDEAGTIWMEFGSREEALEVRRKRYHAEYLKEQESESGYMTVSLDLPAEMGDDGDMTSILDLIGDPDMDTEKMASEGILKEELPAALSELTLPEQELILAFYTGEEKMTENRYAIETGCSRRCIRERHKSALRKLRLHYRRKRLL